MEKTSNLPEGCVHREEIRSSSCRDKDASTVQSSHGSTHKSVTRISSLPVPNQRKCPSHVVRLERSQSYPLACSHTCRFCDGLCVCSDCPRAPNNCDNQTCRKEIQEGRTFQHHKQRLSSMRDSLPVSLESLEDVFVLVDTEPSVFPAHESQLYEQGEHELQNCGICISDTPLVLSCCKMPVCDICLRMYIREKVSVRVTNISCPNPFCNDSIPREEIILNLSNDLQNRFLRFLIDENRDPNRKTCPNCNLVANFKKDVMVTKRILGRNKYQVSCPCGLLWCFRCHAPWHKNVSCKQYQKEDRLLREWAEEHQSGQLNARKCPKCKVLIQRIDGCNEMRCTKCQTNFCYACGKRLRKLIFSFDHNSRYSVFGCQKIFMPDNVVIRKAIRGTIFGCVVTAAGFGIILAVGVGIVLGIGLAPVYVPYFVRKEYKLRRWIRQQRRAQAEGSAGVR